MQGRIQDSRLGGAKLGYSSFLGIIYAEIKELSPAGEVSGAPGSANVDILIIDLVAICFISS